MAEGRPSRGEPETITEAAPADWQGRLGESRVLFWVGFFVLFLELACIRWFAAHVVFLQFFTNIILIAAFLGNSLGCLCAKQKTDWLARLPLILFVAVLLGFLVFFVNHTFVIGVNVGNQDSPQVVYFGTEMPKRDLAKFIVPIEVVAGMFFALVTIAFVGLGQVLGRAFLAYPALIPAYAWNIGGSLAGILAFGAISVFMLPPLVWFGGGFAGVVYLLHKAGSLTRAHLVTLGATLAIVGLADHVTGKTVYWSPYYAVRFKPDNLQIDVNSIGHQSMLSWERTTPAYPLIHLLQRDSGGKPFEDVLVLGAGSGNDVLQCLKFGVQRIDAVEIDPIIQWLGKQHHPDRPYDDPRVTVHLNDGRRFLRQTDRKYNAVVYALVDSLILHSSFANLRLESFLFTEEAFRDVKSALKPDGVFVTYNFFRQGWIVERIAEMMQRVFGQPPIIISLPYAERIPTNQALQSNVTMMIAGNTEALEKAFREHGEFWLSAKIADSVPVNGFEVEAARSTGEERDRWLKIAPATVERVASTDAPAPLQSAGQWIAPSGPVGASGVLTATDNWPFLYLRAPSLPDFYIRVMILLGGLSLAIVLWLAPGHRLGGSGRMFFLGAGFLLVETKAVVHLALVFGSTWMVNSAAFFAILLMVLASNLYVLWKGRVDLRWHYAFLIGCLALNAAVPLDIFLEGGVLWRYIAPCALVMAPIFFAGVIFAVSFRASNQPDRDFGTNIAGSVVGGLSEYASTLLGFRYLMLLAIVYYALSAILVRRSPPPA